MHRHFSAIAEKYGELRTTDLEPVLCMGDELEQLQRIEAIDVGSGDGRYVLQLLQHLGDRLCLCCTDNNKAMLRQLKENLAQHGFQNCLVKQSTAESLALRGGSLDCVFTFNAIHLFEISAFLQEASRVLRDRGYLFIYTRLRSQNDKSIWGEYFPLFRQRETRLYELEELERLVEGAPRLEIQSIESFTYQRMSCLDSLIELAGNRQYSTFYLYNAKELEESLKEFKRSLQQRFDDLDHIGWVDGNVLLVIRKRAG
jgi:ubiquinone/menaquinone biosynthesis C-methylase UbiE